MDKAAVLDMLLLQQAAASSEHANDAESDTPAGGLSVYVGDSMSDLAPLLSADLGIVVGQNRLLRRVAAAAGITLRPLIAGCWRHLSTLTPDPPIDASLLILRRVSKKNYSYIIVVCGCVQPRWRAGRRRECCTRPAAGPT